MWRQRTYVALYTSGPMYYTLQTLLPCTRIAYVPDTRLIHREYCAAPLAALPWRPRHTSDASSRAISYVSANELTNSLPLVLQFLMSGCFKLSLQRGNGCSGSLRILSVLSVVRGLNQGAKVSARGAPMFFPSSPFIVLRPNVFPQELSLLEIPLKSSFSFYK